MLGGKLTMSGKLVARKIPGVYAAPWTWRLRNALSRSYLWGFFATLLARNFSRLTGVLTMTSELSIRARLNGVWYDYGVVSYRVITDAGVQLMATDFNNGSTDISNLKYHGCGTGTTAESAGDTALVTESTTALNPDNTRALGTNSNPTNPTYKSVGVLTFDADAAITEHGLFSTSGTGTGVLWDRSKFAAINVVGANGDSIQFSYTLTLNSGG